MRSVITFLVRKVHWLVFLLLEGVSLTLVVRGNHYQGSVFFTQANVVVAGVQGMERKLLRYAYMPEVNRELTERNVIMQKQIADLRAALARLSHDSTETERMMADSLRRCDLISAKVIGRSIRSLDNTLTIDRGKDDGVAEGMGVVCGTGIVGIVTRVTPHHAEVMSILSTQSNITCRIRGSGYIGYLHWQGGNMLVSTMDDVPPHARVRVGMAIETSNYSQVFPAGLFVGRVIRIGTAPDGLSFRLFVQLSTDMARLDDVMVVKNN